MGIMAQKIGRRLFNIPLRLNDQSFSCEIYRKQPKNLFQQYLTNVKGKHPTEVADMYIRFWVEFPETQHSAHIW